MIFVTFVWWSVEKMAEYIMVIGAHPMMNYWDQRAP